MHIRMGREGGHRHIRMHIHIRIHIRTRDVHTVAAGPASSPRRLHRVRTSTASCPVSKRRLWLAQELRSQSVRAVACSQQPLRLHRHPAPSHAPHRSGPHLLLEANS